ncbi:hypothetical protein AAFN86_13120 [Roseomonas sp. CAU 1739]|uniref:hypothetical protein n=1 Tax=Roseomonas sp. CAU 1739 TaxID=3140364 RepID=UPI00325BBC56
MRRILPAILLGMTVLAMPARGQLFVPDGAVILFAPGSAEVTVDARNALLGFLRPPRPPGFRGQCLRGHADRGPGAEALALARAQAIAGVMARQGIDPRDVALDAVGDRVPAKLAAPGLAEPMNDRVELRPCPGPRLAGVAEAEALALDVAVLPGFIAALAPLVARALGCAEPELWRGAIEVPPFQCPTAVPASAVPVLTVQRVAGGRRVAVVLAWPTGPGDGEAWWRAAAAAGAVLDLFGLPVGPVLTALAAGPGEAPVVEVSARGLRAEVEAGPGLLMRLRVVTADADDP